MKKNKSPSTFLGIDVGTGSARAGLFTKEGKMLASASHPIQMWKMEGEVVEQSSEDIWKSCALAVRQAIAKAGLSPASVQGIGFDATCSLVVLDSQNRPLTVSPSGNSQRNIIVWMDHRAVEQADRINRLGHEILRNVGGVISPEMQTPKLLWLKENLPTTWKKAALFLDLPDFLTYRATGIATRSLCTTVCKWTYQSSQKPKKTGWDPSYFRKIGLEDLVQEKFRRIGETIRPMGEKIGSGLTSVAARDLGLPEGTPVGVSIIDAHAGGLGLLGAQRGGKEVQSRDLKRRLALIGGTSSCHMAVSKKPRFIKGIWGPYFSAMIPGFYLTEGGQSATGSLIDHVIFSHPASTLLREEAQKSSKTVYELLNSHLKKMAFRERVSHRAELTRDLHIQPDFHGNRSPRANPLLKGMISGLTLSVTRDDLARQYLAAIQAVAYGTLHILEEMNRGGYQIDKIFACGGGTKNEVFLQEHATITGCEILLSEEPEAVLLGAAVLATVAAQTYPTVLKAMMKMNRVREVIFPEKGEVAKYHKRKYRVFHQMHRDHVKYSHVMKS